MEKNVLLIMPSQNKQLKQEALRTLKANTVHPFDVFEFPDEVNRGWMGGCNLGLKEADKYDYVILANDDILVPGTGDWLKNMIEVMENKKDCGALSVLTMSAMGWARLNVDNCSAKTPFEVPFCSFFFVMLRSDVIKKIGLLDETLPGGDDLDYCFRIKKAGYKIGIAHNVFIWHHYAQTGKKIYGDYWDSRQHSERIQQALIQKHGFKEYLDFQNGGQV